MGNEKKRDCARRIVVVPWDSIDLMRCMPFTESKAPSRASFHIEGIQNNTPLRFIIYNDIIWWENPGHQTDDAQSFDSKSMFWIKSAASSYDTIRGWRTLRIGARRC